MTGATTDHETARECAGNGGVVGGVSPVDHKPTITMRWQAAIGWAYHSRARALGDGRRVIWQHARLVGGLKNKGVWTPRAIRGYTRGSESGQTSIARWLSTAMSCCAAHSTEVYGFDLCLPGGDLYHVWVLVVCVQPGVALLVPLPACCSSLRSAL